MSVDRAVEPAPAAGELTVARLRPADAAELGALFVRNDVAEITRGFHPFPLTAERARALVAEASLDRFYGARDGDGRLVGFSMLRGWNEGYEVPSLGVLVDREQHGRGIGRRLTRWTCD